MSTSANIQGDPGDGLVLMEQALRKVPVQAM